MNPNYLSVCHYFSQMTNVVETCLNFVRSSFKVTAGEAEKSGRAPELGSNDLPIALHGSEASRNAPLNSQPQTQVKNFSLHYAYSCGTTSNGSLTTTYYTPIYLYRCLYH